MTCSTTLFLACMIFWCLQSVDAFAKPGWCKITEKDEFQTETSCQHGDTVLIDVDTKPLREVTRYCNLSKKIIREIMPHRYTKLPNYGHGAIVCIFQKKTKR